MGVSKARRAEVAARRAKAIQLRLAGVPLDKIAEQLEYSSRAAVSKDIARALEANTSELAGRSAELRATELERLDRLQAAAWGKALQGDLEAGNFCLRLIDRRIRLLGLDTPVRADLTIHQVDPADTALAELLNEARARVAAEEARLRGEE
ncbi:hypothetical protein [Actinomadura miaoliensis]|uniref:Helix-turn-helix domain-containing protein n=1 Tax=Actinomadura miaoliensis TaxID=430685 RepID=A0ABP7WBI1_9ACTN